MDMRDSTTPYNAPESYLGEMSGRAMAEYYGMPNYSYGGLTDSKLLDEQAGVEAALSLFQAAMARSTLIHDVGYMDTGMTASWELIVLGDEIIGHLKRIMEGIDLGDEQLALGVIEAMGPGGNFLMAEHTLGRKLSEGAEKIRLFHETFPVRAEIVQIHGFSGHADQAELLHLLAPLKSKGRNLFIVHGENDQCTALAGKLREANFARVEVARRGQRVTL